MEIGPWIEQLFPRIEPVRWGEACWLALMKTRSPEHHPPLYWLGRALDALADGGATEALAARLVGAHGAEACNGWSERDERVQDVLSEACAYAWAAAHLGPPRFSHGEAPDAPPLIHVPAHDAFVAARRLWPVRTMEELLRAVGERTAEAAALLPAAAGRIVYIDIYLNPRMYAQEVGYRVELTEPLRAAVKHFAGEHHVGHVLTRPFQWGNAIEAGY